MVLLLPRWGWAIQIHPQPEGLYVHLLSHLYFTVSLILILYWSGRLVSSPPSAWRYLRLSLVFFIFWNLDAAAVHLFEVFHPSGLPSYYSLAVRPHFICQGFRACTYYFLRFDHFFCVPAMFFFWKALRAFAGGDDDGA